MSEPRIETSIRGLCSGIIDTISSLNMEPEPLPKEAIEKTGDGLIYLADCDGWAKHAQEHNRANLKSAQQIIKELNIVASDIWNIIEYHDIPEKTKKKLRLIVGKLKDLV